MAGDRIGGFDSIYIVIKLLWKKTPFGWWLAFAVVGFILAWLVPAGSWLISLWELIGRRGAAFWLSALVDTILFALLITFLRAWMLEDRSVVDDAPKRDVRSEHLLLDDVPLGEAEQDELERDEIAATIAPLLVLPTKAKSVVIALEATWGEGKSSLLSLITGRLKRHVDQPIVLQFNPWFVNSREHLLRLFFQQLIAGLDKDELAAAAAIRELKSYAHTLEIAVASPLGAIPNYLIESRTVEGSLADEKARVDQAFASVDRPMIVIIDDIDRLPADDIRCIFQLVKIVCDFERVGYLLAFDPDPVDRALKFGDLYEHGSRYREKIVQLGFKLPRAPYLARRRYFDKRIEQRIESWQLDVDEEDRKVLAEAIPIALRVATTPRDMKRLLNAWCMAAKMLSRETNLGDVLAMEMLALQFPAVFRLIQRAPDRMTGSGLFNYEPEPSAEWASRNGQKDGGQSSQEDQLAALLKNIDDEERAPVLHDALVLLFPFLVNKGTYPSMSARVSNRRLDDRDALETYFARRVPGGAMSRRTADSFFTDPSSRAGILADAVAANVLSGTLRFFANNLRTPHELFDALLNINLAVADALSRGKVDSVDAASVLILRILRSVTAEEARSMLGAICKDPDFLRVAGHVLKRIDDEAKQWEGILAPQFLQGLKDYWLEQVRILGIGTILKKTQRPIGVLKIWGQLEEPRFKTVRTAIQGYLVTQNEVSILLDAFAEEDPLGIVFGLDEFVELIADPARIFKQVRDSPIGTFTPESQEFADNLEKYFVNKKRERALAKPSAADTV